MRTATLRTWMFATDGTGSCTLIHITAGDCQHPSHTSVTSLQCVRWLLHACQDGSRVVTMSMRQLHDGGLLIGLTIVTSRRGSLFCCPGCRGVRTLQKRGKYLAYRCPDKLTHLQQSSGMALCPFCHDDSVSES